MADEQPEGEEQGKSPVVKIVLGVVVSAANCFERRGYALCDRIFRRGG